MKPSRKGSRRPASTSSAPALTKKLAGLALIHAAVTIAGWYIVEALAQGAVDGTGFAPAWLTALHYLVLALMAPAGLAALAFVPGFGAFTVPAFIVFSLVASANGALVIALGHFAARRLRPPSGDEENEAHRP